VAPPEGARRAGDVYYTVLGRGGLYTAGVVRKEMGEAFSGVQLPVERAEAPAFDFVEL
jgi:hypothetical protein